MQPASPPPPESRAGIPGAGPWLARKDWAAGKIKSNETPQLAITLMLAATLGGIGIAACLRLPHGWHRGNLAAWIALAFWLGGLFFLISLINGLYIRRRFGHCFFVPSGVPIPVGGMLEGTIQTGKPLRLQHDLQITISCIQTEKRGKHSFQSVLWQGEQCYSARANFIETEPGHTAIPVSFKLPGDQPECRRDGRVSVCWRLEARCQMPFPSFQECFDLPVFNTPASLAPDTGTDEAAPATGTDEAAPATRDDDAGPTAGLLAGVEEIRQDQHSRIQVGTGPLGQEFYFPAGRNMGDALGWTLAALVCYGAAVWIIAEAIRLLGGAGNQDILFLKAANAIFMIAGIILGLIVGLFGLLFSFSAATAWFKSTRVTVDSTGVHAHDDWLCFFHRSRHIAAGDIDHFEIESRSSSHSPTRTYTYWDLQICTRAARDSGQAALGVGAIILAKNIADKEEAQWLADQMACALGRPPFPARA
jgi:hypothetical protein